MDTSASTPDTEHLLEAATRGDDDARDALLTRHRDRLERMVKLRMDPRLSARVDPSDVVQEAMIEAWQELPDYLETRRVPFYPWLRRIAWERLVKLHRLHVEAKRRSVRREAVLLLPAESSATLADYLAQTGTNPSGKAAKRELREKVRAALDDLPEQGREVLVLLYLEQLSVAEAAAVLDLSEGAVKMRHMRALKRLRHLLGEGSARGGSR